MLPRSYSGPVREAATHSPQLNDPASKNSGSSEWAGALEATPQFSFMMSALQSVGVRQLLFILLAVVAIGAICVASLWRLFEKADEPGWAAIVPVYGTVVLLRVVNRPKWWIILLHAPVAAPLFVPALAVVLSIVSVLAGIVVTLDLAKVFGQNELFGIAMLVFPFVLMPILALGPAKHIGDHPRGWDPMSHPTTSFNNVGAARSPRR